MKVIGICQENKNNRGLLPNGDDTPIAQRMPFILPQTCTPTYPGQGINPSQDVHCATVQPPILAPEYIRITDYSLKAYIL